MAVHRPALACEDRAVSDDQEIPAQIAWPINHPVWRSPVVANQVAFQLVPGPEGDTADTMAISFGYVSTPTLAGTPEQQMAFLRSVLEKTDGPLILEIDPQARVIITIAQARRMLEALAELLARLDAEGTGAA